MAGWPRIPGNPLGHRRWQYAIGPAAALVRYTAVPLPAQRAKAYSCTRGDRCALTGPPAHVPRASTTLSVSRLSVVAVKPYSLSFPR